MTIRIKCAKCGKTLKAPEKLAGKKSRCPNCKTPLTVPAAEPDGWGEDAIASLLSEPADRPMPDVTATPPALRPTRSASESPEGRSGAHDAPRVPSHTDMMRTQAPPRRSPTFARAAPPGLGATATRNSKRLLSCLFALTLLPLLFSLVGDQTSDTRERLTRTLEKHPEVADKLQQAGQDEEIDIFRLLPDHRIEGAHLARNSKLHWAYAAAAAGGFFLLILLLFPKGEAAAPQLLAVGLFTATIGILLLIVVQWIAEFTQGFWLRGRGILVLVFYILKFIGFSYRAALDANNGFFLSMLGFTFGVGLCEELTKALPVIWQYQTKGNLDWRGACIWGLASGVGFGVAEGIMYCSDFYNGISTGQVYLVRFVSCVALHAVWAASVGIFVAVSQPMFDRDMGWGEWAMDLGKVLAVPMVLHALYDTMLKKQMNAAALVVALLSFVWLLGLIEFVRRGEQAVNAPRLAGATR